ncbi:hypothetical protein H1R20_g6639, partial [Candolleomyces eurysporus]
MDFDLDGTYTPVMRLETLRGCLALSAIKQLYAFQLDFCNAYLNGRLDEEIYMKQPPGFSDNTGHVCRLRQSLYGLKQAGNIWNKEFNTAMKEIGFSQLKSDYCCYLCRIGSTFTILLLWVNDIISFTNSNKEESVVAQQLGDKFEIKVLGQPSMLLGMKVEQSEDRRVVSLSQTHYIESILKRFSLEDANPVTTPLNPNVDLDSLDTPPTNNSLDSQESSFYATAIGTLSHAALGSRLDILHAVYRLAQFTKNPQPKHWTAVKRIFRYLKGTKDLRLTFGGPEQEWTTEITTYCDADWASNADRKSVVNEIGPENVISISSDNTGNTWVAHAHIVESLKHAFNLPDPIHHINNTWKDIASLEYFKSVTTNVRSTVKYFKQSHFAKEQLRQLRIQVGLGAGLESPTNTRFLLIVWSGISVRRCLPAIRQLNTTEVIELPLELHDVYILNSPATLQFEIQLTQIISVGDPFARAIQCLEATATNPADVYLYWIAIISRLKTALETAHLPDPICQAIHRIVNRRFQQFFINGPTNIHLSVFYLHPAFAQGVYPFGVGLGPGQTPLQYWKTFEKTANAGILAAIAVKLFSAVPHSMADERTMSCITMLNTAQHSRQSVSSVIAMAQIRNYYHGEKLKKLRRSARPRPVLRFFDVNKPRRGIDDDERDSDSDESDDDASLASLGSQPSVHM